ncbi:MAG: hypothetical protein RR383_09920, partial [Muribaculaceae bacterium]
RERNCGATTYAPAKNIEDVPLRPRPTQNSILHPLRTFFSQKSTIKPHYLCNTHPISQIQKRVRTLRTVRTPANCHIICHLKNHQYAHIIFIKKNTILLLQKVYIL